MSEQAKPAKPAKPYEQRLEQAQRMANTLQGIEAGKSIQAVIDHLADLERLVRGLARALEPFGTAKERHGLRHDQTVIALGITVGDLTRARTALATVPAELRGEKREAK